MSHLILPPPAGESVVFYLNVSNMDFFVSPFFVRRALFDYDGSASDLTTPNQALSFNFGDILHVSSAGEEEWWPARHLSPPPPNCPEVGVIPSRRRSEFKFVLYFLINMCHMWTAALDDANKSLNAIVLGGSAR